MIDLNGEIHSFEISNGIRITNIYSLFEASYNSKSEFEGESHNFWECVYVKEGSISTISDDRLCNLYTGNLIFHKPLEFHKLQIRENKSAQLLTFSFDAEPHSMKFFENKIFSLKDDSKDIIDKLISFLNKNDYVTKNNIKEFLKHKNKSNLYHQTLVAYIQLLFILLYDNDKLIQDQTVEATSIYFDIVKYMNLHIDKQLSVSHIAKHFYISETKLKELFYENAGISIHKYFLQAKLSSAIKLLHAGISITETADRLGFSSQSYFSVVFRREFGCSPTEYLKTR